MNNIHAISMPGCSSETLRVGFGKIWYWCGGCHLLAPHVSFLCFRFGCLLFVCLLLVLFFSRFLEMIQRPLSHSFPSSYHLIS